MKVMLQMWLKRFCDTFLGALYPPKKRVFEAFGTSIQMCSKENGTSITKVMLQMWLKSFWNTFLGVLYLPEKRTFWSFWSNISDERIDCEWKMKMFRRCCEKRPKVSFRDSVLLVKRVVLRETAIFGPPCLQFSKSIVSNRLRTEE